MFVLSSLRRTVQCARNRTVRMHVIIANAGTTGGRPLFNSRVKLLIFLPPRVEKSLMEGAATETE